MSLPVASSSRALTTWRVLTRPATWPFPWRDRCGDPYIVNALNGRIVVTGRPDWIQAMFKLPADVVAPFVPEVIAPFVGARSVLVARGAPHARARKLLMPPFHGDRMRAYGATIADVARRAIADVPVDGTVAVVDMARRIALEVIVRVIFGVEGVGAVSEQIGRTIEAAHPALFFARVLQHRAFPPFARWQREVAAGDRLLRDHIASVRARPAGDDVLSLLLAARDDDGQGMDDDEVMDQLRTMIAAGHETTAIGIAWVIHDLLRDERTAGDLRDEVGGGDVEAWGRAPLLRACCDEALRLHPVIPDVMRTLVAGVEVCGHALPPGTTIDAQVQLAHANRDVYVEPGAFRPRRFLERTFTPFEYLPFGGGLRRCIGAAFASYEMRIVLATFLTEARWELVDAGPAEVERRTLMLAPKGGVRVRRRPQAPRLRVAA